MTTDNGMTARWNEARKNALKMAGIPYADDATGDDLQALCKQHNLKVALGSGQAAAPASPAEVDDLKAQIAQMKADLDKLIAAGLQSPTVGGGVGAEALAMAVAKAVKEQLSPEKDELGLTDPKYIDKDDRLDKPERFFSWRFWNMISFSMKYGVAEKPPMGPILFLPDTGRWVKQGGEDVAHYVCTAEVHSKKQAQWLREHEHFGIIFFDNQRSLNTSHGEEWARTAQKWATSLAAKKPHELMQLAHQNGIGTNIDEDPDDLRRRLIGRLAQNEMELMAQFAERANSRGRELVETVGTV